MQMCDVYDGECRARALHNADTMALSAGEGYVCGGRPTFLSRVAGTTSLDLST